jgi:hypothetical protein
MTYMLTMDRHTHAQEVDLITGLPLIRLDRAIQCSTKLRPSQRWQRAETS